MRPDCGAQHQSEARVIPLTRYLRRRGPEPEGDPFPPSSTPAAARKPPAPVFVEAISAQGGAASRLAAVARAA